MPSCLQSGTGVDNIPDDGGGWEEELGGGGGTIPNGAIPNGAVPNGTIPNATLSPPELFCIKMGSSESCFNVLMNIGDCHETASISHNF